MVSNKRSFVEVADNPSFHTALPHLAEMLQEACYEGDLLREKGLVPTTDLDGRWVAELSVHDFLVRICKYGRCSPGVFDVMTTHLERFSARVQLTSLNIHRVTLAAFMVATKYLDDMRLSLQHYANIGGITLEEINRIEESYLGHLDWELFVNDAPDFTSINFSPAPSPATSCLESEPPLTPLTPLFID